ncbi:dihydropteroate synthase [Heliophilum fasciatum]|uniref:Dihydropteroate synthase n=1 Tax=Heliophilum fasciatum TaxID=35700 RepID=A0A4R2SB19_9FIRM|nr:dihydropteroate synthase [Heliophilum fasciatum]MCW2277069.1 dihydropteroate synthase [Heliophilum fasciatum]TCP68405.1 dihydropteroate synthase [Heliophilum fasciatum]
MSPVQVIEIYDRDGVRNALEAIGCDPAGTAVMNNKGVHRLLRLGPLTPQAANLLKQEMLAKGGDCALHKNTCAFSVESTDALLMGTLRQFERVCQTLRRQPFGLAEVGQRIEQVLRQYDRACSRSKAAQVLDCRGKSLVLGRQTRIMGILNLTPDSFSDGGSYPTVRDALLRMEAMVAEGADVIDIGAESTRPHHRPLSAEEEMERLLPFLRELVVNCPVPVSVDTYKAKTAKWALEAGAHIINDIWGLQYDDEMAAVAAHYGAPVVVMHNRREREAGDVMRAILAFFDHSVQRAIDAGLPEEAIILDPGVGFGKTHEENLAVLDRLGELRVMGKPVLLGASRKSVIGNTLDLPVEQRLEGTLATTALAAARGVDLVRVHDVQANRRVATMIDAIVRTGAKDEPMGVGTQDEAMNAGGGDR